MDDRKVTLPTLAQMKRDGRKIVGVVTYDYQMAQIVDRAGVDIVSVGDSVGVNLWGHASELEVTLDEMVLVCDAAVRAAIRLVKEGGADLVKLDGASAFPDAVRAVTRAGIPVWAQFGVTPHTALKHGGMTTAAAEPATVMVDTLKREAALLEDAGASMLDFTGSGPVAGPEVVRAIDIPVLGGLGGGPWLDGRVRSVVAAIGYLAAAVDDPADRYANVASIALIAIKAFSDDVRAARQIRGAVAGAPKP